MSNIVVISDDTAGIFIRKGSFKYRPLSNQETGGLKRGKIAKAWPISNPDNSKLAVDTPIGRFIWVRSE